MLLLFSLSLSLSLLLSHSLSPSISVNMRNLRRIFSTRGHAEGAFTPILTDECSSLLMIPEAQSQPGFFASLSRDERPALVSQCLLNFYSSSQDEKTTFNALALERLARFLFSCPSADFLMSNYCGNA
jgi:hypothetical protein